MGENKQILYDVEFRALPTDLDHNLGYLTQVYGAKVGNGSRHCVVYNLTKENLSYILQDKNIRGYKPFSS